MTWLNKQLRKNIDNISAAFFTLFLKALIVPTFSGAWRRLTSDFVSASTVRPPWREEEEEEEGGGGRAWAGEGGGGDENFFVNQYQTEIFGGRAIKTDRSFRAMFLDEFLFILGSQVFLGTGLEMTCTIPLSVLMSGRTTWSFPKYYLRPIFFSFELPICPWPVCHPCFQTPIWRRSW